MDFASEHANTLWFLLSLIGLGVALTFYVFHWRKFDEGYEKGEAADPSAVACDPRTSSKTSGLRFCGMIDEPVVISAGNDTYANSLV